MKNNNITQIIMTTITKQHFTTQEYRQKIKEFYDSGVFEGILDLIYADTSEVRFWMEENGFEQQGDFEDWNFSVEGMGDEYCGDDNFLYDTLSYHYSVQQFVDDLKEENKELEKRNSILVDQIEVREHIIALAMYHHSSEETDAEYYLIENAMKYVSEKSLKDTIAFIDKEWRPAGMHNQKGIDTLQEYLDE